MRIGRHPGGRPGRAAAVAAAGLLLPLAALACGTAAQGYHQSRASQAGKGTAGGATSASARVGFLMRARGAVALKRGGTSAPARSFTPLRRGDVVTLAKDAEAEVVLFAGGKRTRITGPGQIVLKDGALAAKGGVVKPLKPIPMQMLKAVSSRSETIGGVLLRGPVQSVETRSPRNGVRDAGGDGAVTLSWKVPADAPAGIPVQVTLSGGAEPLTREVTTPTTTLTVPGGTIEPGRTYKWKVECVVPGVLTGIDSATFRLLTAEERAALGEAERAAAAFVPEEPGDAGREMLLGYVYDRYGLAPDALAQYEEALRKVGADPALEGAVKRLRTEVRE